ncbi:MAG: hypothetical protein LBQ95_08635 [Lachnospiraceae bacterium]|jgi:hypothetical protein|nr:hypothetical protein [Lachnospiraceae bacterium]
MSKYKLNLQFFADGETGDGANNSGNANKGGNGGDTGTSRALFTQEQLNEIVGARAARAEQSALKDFFTKQGLSEAEITAAITEYKTKNKGAQDEKEQELERLRAQVKERDNKDALEKKGVTSDNLDYVIFKVNALMKSDSLDFEKATDKFLKDNPRFAEASGTYRMTGGAPGGAGGSEQGAGDIMNQLIRNARR